MDHPQRRWRRSHDQCFPSSKYFKERDGGFVSSFCLYAGSPLHPPLCHTDIYRQETAVKNIEIHLHLPFPPKQRDKYITIEAIELLLIKWARDQCQMFISFRAVLMKSAHMGMFWKRRLPSLFQEVFGLVWYVPAWQGCSRCCVSGPSSFPPTRNDMYRPFPASHQAAGSTTWLKPKWSSVCAHP